MNNKLPNILANSIGFNAYRLGLLFKRGLIRTLHKYKLSPEQWQILVALNESEKSINQSTLAAITLKDRHSISRIIRKMETTGWVKRTTDKNDSRANLVKMSVEGKRKFPKVKKSLMDAFTPIDSAVSEGDKANFINYCGKMSDTLIKIFPQAD
ncbi:MAG: MarR family transcriptional regulator [Bdellovibrionaceae bacterium]|jgi:DNA-binding MarR family transcriptional regulator|nr:MarR family transcriptional regulator [Pseudobdellovibrionaceae bacterium]